MRPLLAAALLCSLLPAAHAADLAPDGVQAFLAAHARAAGVTLRSSGLQVRVLKSGTGRPVAPRDTVQMYYTAKLADGRVVAGRAAATGVGGSSDSERFLKEKGVKE